MFNRNWIPGIKWASIGKALTQAIKTQIKWVWKGIPSQNEAGPIVEAYFQKKSLAQLGYSFDASDLETFEADCFTIIENELKKLETMEMKKGIK